MCVCICCVCVRHPRGCDVCVVCVMYIHATCNISCVHCVGVKQTKHVIHAIIAGNFFQQKLQKYSIE